MINYNVNNGIANLVWNMEGYPMNVLNDASMNAFEEALDNALADENVKGMVITSAKDSFVAGADLKMLKEMASRDISKIDPAEAFQEARKFNQLFRKMEIGEKPVVAIINGYALGGGFELCLASHYRIALNNPKTKIGLPEAKLGLLPGAGGTQRVPRMIGMEKAAPLLLEGRELAPDKALKAGLINELAKDAETAMEAAVKWIEANPKPLQPWDEKNRKGKVVGKKNFRVPGGNVQSPKAAQLLLPGTALMMGKTYGNYPAQLAIMNCIFEGLQLPMEKALEVESRYFTSLLLDPVAKNMIRTLFFAKNAADKGEARPKDVPPTNIKKVGILGAGMMGAGIAYVSAMAGLEVVLKDISMENALKSSGMFGKLYSENLLKKRISRGKMTQEKAEEILSRILPTDKAEDLKGCDLIIEAVFENRELKAKVTQEAEAQITETAVFGTNTSTLPITGLAEASARPENFIGIHFFSPVDKMPLVEIIRGEKTSDYALALTLDYVMKIRKTPIVVNDSRGFYTSRSFSTYTAEGMEMLSEGINPVFIENAGKMAGMPVGALDVADAVALDLAYKIMKQTEADTGEKFEDMTGGKVIRLFVEDLDRVGKKAKKGFYTYPEKGKKYLWEGLAEHFPLAEKQPTLEETKKRFLHRQAMEAVRCLEEGVLRNATDGDIGSIFAWGFAPYSGGVFSYIDTIGLETFVKECDELADKHGERFRPTDKLREMAKNGETFHGQKKVEPAAV